MHQLNRYHWILPLCVDGMVGYASSRSRSHDLTLGDVNNGVSVRCCVLILISSKMISFDSVYRLLDTVCTVDWLEICGRSGIGSVLVYCVSSWSQQNA